MSSRLGVEGSPIPSSEVGCPPRLILLVCIARSELQRLRNYCLLCSVPSSGSFEATCKIEALEISPIWHV